ncbi:ArsB/NhaD family transporter [Rhodococcus sp. NPDC058521]|uniref:ArsB/NhaD family transporter n=1 Tax=Rhodococcus sp. NPDC058521 TaxID=3346536 RepID=UPI003652D499
MSNLTNLTNLIAFSATGLGFTRLAALMALPWIVTIVVAYAAIRLFFHRALSARPALTAPIRAVQQKPVPSFALVVIAATPIEFGLSGVVGVSPFWPALAGAPVLAVQALRDGRTALRRISYAADLWFCGFVLLLGVVVAGLADGPVGSTIASVLPSDVGFPSLLTVGVVAALASNLINNLPATLLLLAALGPDAPPALVLALLIGVDLGPNLTCVGTLATMLWRRVTARSGAPADLRTYHTARPDDDPTHADCRDHRAVGSGVIAGSGRCEVSLTSRTDAPPSR